jgi:predicted small lipoprotein YifL
MTLLTRTGLAALAICFVSSLAGCANDGPALFSEAGFFGPTATASIPNKPKVDPACQTLVSQIGALRQEGIADKVEKAAAKKYKMTAAELNKANAEFQGKCSPTT